MPTVLTQSTVTEVAAADPETARAHFESLFRFETDDRTDDQEGEAHGRIPWVRAQDISHAQCAQLKLWSCFSPHRADYMTFSRGSSTTP